ncbi:hypothetical protein ACVWYV_003981 [Pantoea eucalypti]
MRRDELAVRTWYQASKDMNEYGEETVRIKGVYATEVGNDTPILTRLMQWRIVPKRAVDLDFEFKDAPASSRSSVNNCTEPTGSEAAIDFTKPPTRAERRRILKRLREKPAQEQPEPDKYHTELSHCTERETLKKSFFEISRLTLSDGEAVRMMKGHTIRVGELSYWSGTSGYIFHRRRKNAAPLKRFNALARKRGIQLPD